MRRALHSLDRLANDDMSGQLSHIDFTRVFDCMLPAKFTCFEMPNLDRFTSWTTWADRSLRQFDKNTTYFSVVNVTPLKHWIMFETVPATRLITMHDSLDIASLHVATAARCIVKRMASTGRPMVGVIVLPLRPSNAIQALVVSMF
jgi:hypothetical protein